MKMVKKCSLGVLCALVIAVPLCADVQQALGDFSSSMQILKKELTRAKWILPRVPEDTSEKLVQEIDAINKKLGAYDVRTTEEVDKNFGYLMKRLRRFGILLLESLEDGDLQELGGELYALYNEYRGAAKLKEYALPVKEKPITLAKFYDDLMTILMNDPRARKYTGLLYRFSTKKWEEAIKLNELLNDWGFNEAIESAKKKVEDLEKDQRFAALAKEKRERELRGIAKKEQGKELEKGDLEMSKDEEKEFFKNVKVNVDAWIAPTTMEQQPKPVQIVVQYVKEALGNLFYLGARVDTAGDKAAQLELLDELIAKMPAVKIQVETFITNLYETLPKEQKSALLQAKNDFLKQATELFAGRDKSVYIPESGGQIDILKMVVQVAKLCDKTLSTFFPPIELK
jgi:hypothetical protein